MPTTAPAALRVALPAFLAPFTNAPAADPANAPVRRATPDARPVVAREPALAPGPRVVVAREVPPDDVPALRAVVEREPLPPRPSSSRVPLRPATGRASPEGLRPPDERGERAPLAFDAADPDLELPDLPPPDLDSPDDPPDLDAPDFELPDPEAPALDPPDLDPPEPEAPALD
ncbi:MAG: hypothetical protein H0V09_06765, partial [Gemmatimonadetes bacterium]|nr:hypothetical protein [Gemmatimonadota bacterium]